MKYLKIYALALLSGSFYTSQAQSQEVKGRPNIIFIYTDDQRFDALSVVQKEQGEKARFPWFTTPNLDRLASEGVRFRNAFVINSLCSPSRSSTPPCARRSSRPLSRQMRAYGAGPNPKKLG